MNISTRGAVERIATVAVEVVRDNGLNITGILPFEMRDDSVLSVVLRLPEDALLQPLFKAKRA